MKKFVALMMVVFMMLTAAAVAESANFTPSVSGKPAPELVPVVDEDGNSYIGYVRDAAGNIIYKIPADGLIITPISEMEHEDTSDYIAECLKWGYECILSVADLGDMPADNHEGNVAADIDAELADMGLLLVHDQMIVKDLFHVHATEELTALLAENEEYYVDVTFEPHLDAIHHLLVLQSIENIHWHVVPHTDYTINEDFTVSMKLYDLGLLAFCVEGDEHLTHIGGEVESPAE